MECLVPRYIVQVVVRDHYVGTSGNLLLIVLAATMAIEVIGSEECRLQGDRVGTLNRLCLQHLPRGTW